MKKTLATLLVIALVASVCGMMFVSADADQTNVAEGKTYTTSVLFRQNSEYKWDENSPVAYPDEDGKSLTDGVTGADAADFYDAAFAGFHSGSPDYESNGGYGYVTVDLGETYDLTKFVAYVSTSKIQIAAPTGIAVAVSDDGETWGEATSAAVTEDATASAMAVTIEAALTGRYVQYRFSTTGHWMFVSEVEAYGTPVASDDNSDESAESSEPEVITVTEEIAIDGALEDTGYTKATWVTAGSWQNVNYETGDAAASYTIRTDAENIYLAVKYTDAVTVTQALNPEAWTQDGATNIRVWVKGDGMETRTYYDLLWDGEKFVPFREKVATEELTIAYNTENDTIEMEIKVAKASLNVTDNVSLWITCSNSDYVAAEGVQDKAGIEGDGIGYNGYHITNYKPAEGDFTPANFPKDWWTTTDLMDTYTCADLVLGTYEEDVTPEPEPDPVEEYKKELEVLVGEDNENADFDLVLKSEATKDGKVVVTVTVENIKEGANLQGVFAKITYDDTKLKLITEKNSDGSLAFGNITVPSDKWENVSSVVTEEVVAEDGTKSYVDTNVIDFNFTNADDESAISADTPFAVTIEFELLENCTYGGVYAASASVTSLGLETQGDKTVFVDYVGNGSYTVAELPVDEPVSSEEESNPAKPGDTGIIVFAVLGVIAIAGAAVVIKARH